MDINKVIFRCLKVGIMLVVVLLIVYATMKASFVAFEYGYKYAIESLVDTPTGDTERTGK